MDRERLRRVTSPERQRRQSVQSRANGASMMESRLAQDGRLPSSEDTSHHIQSSGVFVDGDNSIAESTNELHRTPPRRGIWEWAKVWKGPTNTMSMTISSIDGMLESGAMSEIQDDFSIPSTTASQMLNSEQSAEIASAKMEGLGIFHSVSPSFAQTKRSSDELVAASSTSSTPANQTAQSESWSHEQISTPSAASRDSPPSTPDTPTPQQRRRDAPDSGNTSIHSASGKTSSTESNLESKKKPKKKSKSSQESTPKSHHIPTYKIALAPNVLASART